MTAFRILTTIFGLMIIIGPHSPKGLADSPVPEIDELIRSLDAGRFQLRESATNQLIELGVASLEPIAMHFPTATPEASWRIKRILERISVQSEQEMASLKAIGVLMVLDHKVDSELTALVQQWRNNRSQRAIEYLTSQGAATSPSGIHRQLMLQRPMIVQSTFRSSTTNPLRTAKRKRIPRSMLKAEIEKVVNGNFEDIQKYVFDNLPSLGLPGDNLVEDAALVNAILAGRGNNTSQTFLEFGDNWRGAIQDLEKLSNIHSLIGIRFKNQDLDIDDLQILGSLTALQHVGFSNTKLSGGELSDLKMPPEVSSIELEKYTIDADTMSWLTDQPLMSLVLNGCDISKQASIEFDDFRQLQVLDLRRTKFNPLIFKTWMGMSELKRIYMSACKFPPAAYRQFDQIRPRVIVFNPVSFLGVQGKRAGGIVVSTEIEEVVPGSGAENAGVLPNDIIRAVNGNPIQSFNELKMYISQHDVGESMNLTVLRGSEQVELTAVLGTNEALANR